MADVNSNRTKETTMAATATARRYHHGRRSRVGRDAPSAKGAAYILRAVLQGEAPAEVVLRHPGACVRCARPLTTPESVDTGFGPECAAKLGIAWETSASPDHVQRLDPAALLAAIEAGKATFTATSARTGTRFTYRVRGQRYGDDGRRFVSVLTGPDNGSDYTYLGTIFPGETR